MSQENLELVRRVLEAFPRNYELLRRGDPIEAPFDEELEIDTSRVPIPDGGSGVFKGTEEVRRFWMTWLSAWERIDFTFELRDGGQRVVALMRQSMSSRIQGVEVPIDYAWIFEIKDGRVVRLLAYPDQQAALEAVGLSE